MREESKSCKSTKSPQHIYKRYFIKNYFIPLWCINGHKILIFAMQFLAQSKSTLILLFFKMSVFFNESEYSVDNTNNVKLDLTYSFQNSNLVECLFCQYKDHNCKSPTLTSNL